MASDVKYIYLPVPHEGWDQSAAPHQLPALRSWDLANLLVHEDGKLTLRGSVLRAAGFNSSTAYDVTVPGWTSNSSSREFVSAMPVGSSRVIMGAVNGAIAGFNYPWRVFDRGAAADVSDNEAEAYTVQLVSPYGTIVSAGVGARTPGPGPHQAVFNNRAHYFPFRRRVAVSAGGPDGSVTYLGTNHSLIPLISIDPSADPRAVASYTVHGANAPRACQGLAKYAERLWCAGGVAPSTATPLRPHSLWFTNPAQDSNVLASWQTDAINNEIVVGEERTDDWIMGLAATGRYMLILKRASIHVLTGYSQDSFQIRELTRSTGCVDPRSIVVSEDSVYWLADSGLYQFDGSEVRLVSQRVTPSLAAALSTYTARTISPASGAAYVTPVRNNYLLVSVGKSNFETGGGTQTVGFQALYHMPTGRWSKFEVNTSFLGLGLGSFSAHGAAYFTQGGMTFSNLAYLTDPANTNNLPGDSARLGFDTHFSGSARIPMRLRFPPVRGASPNQRMHLARIGMEARWQGDLTGGFLWEGQPRMALYRYLVGTGRMGETQESAPYNTPLQSGIIALNVPTGAYSAAVDRPSAGWAELRREAEDVFIEITRDLANNGGTSFRCELFGAMLEYQSPTMRKR